MNRFAIPILLQDQYTWALWVIRIIFYYDAACNSFNDIFHKNLIYR